MKSSVTVFCGAQSGRADTYVRAAAELGTAIAQANLRLVYGGAALGLMGVLANAAPSAGGAATGVIPQVSKLIDHLGVLSADFTDAAELARRRDDLVTSLFRYGVHTEAGDQDA